MVKSCKTKELLQFLRVCPNDTGRAPVYSRSTNEHRDPCSAVNQTQSFVFDFQT